MAIQLSQPYHDFEGPEEILKEISQKAKKSGEAIQLTVRDFLAWFAAMRRGPVIVRYIDDLLQRNGLSTSPDYKVAYIDSLIEICAEKKGEKAEITEKNSPEISDPVLRVGSLKSANTPPICCSPNDTLSSAISIMMTNDFSQLPVITTPREVKGVISWRTIGERLASLRKGTLVSDFMEEANIISENSPFFSSLSNIIEHQYVIVRKSDNSISGIVTTTDLSDHFQNLTEPFLLLNEIENQIRILLSRWSDMRPDLISKICAVEVTSTGIFDLNFGDYVRLIQSEEMIKSPFPLNIDRAYFCKHLDQIREIRNDVMHFSPDPTPTDAIYTLRKFSSYLRKLQNIT